MTSVKVKGEQRDKSVVGSKYQLVGSRLSYFTQKLHSAMQWYFPQEYVFVPKNIENASDIEIRAGTHQVPALITPENWVIADTTPILSLLDSRLTEPRFYPKGLIGALSAVIEEYFDEWAARWCIYLRWKTTEETAQHASGFMVKEQKIPSDAQSVVQEQIIGWGRRAARAIGVASENQQKCAEEELVRIFEHFEQHLKQHDFVFGSSPTSVDTVIMGGLRAHFLIDIYPLTLFPQEKFPLVRKWHDNFAQTMNADSLHENLVISDADSLPPFLDFLLKEMSGPFKTFVLGNSKAHNAGEKAFTVNVYGEDVSYLSRPYVEKSRRMLGQKLFLHLQTCTPQEVEIFNQIMKKYQLHNLYPVSTGIATSAL